MIVPPPRGKDLGGLLASMMCAGKVKLSQTPVIAAGPQGNHMHIEIEATWTSSAGGAAGLSCFPPRVKRAHKPIYSAGRVSQRAQFIPVAMRLITQSQDKVRSRAPH